MQKVIKHLLAPAVFGGTLQPKTAGFSECLLNFFPTGVMPFKAIQKAQILFSFSSDKDRRTDSQIRRKNTRLSVLLSLAELKEKRI